jgi:hypothetical protein
MVYLQGIKKTTEKGDDCMARMKFIYAIAIIAAFMFGGLIINLISSIF